MSAEWISSLELLFFSSFVSQWKTRSIFTIRKTDDRSSTTIVSLLSQWTTVVVPPRLSNSIETMTLSHVKKTVDSCIGSVTFDRTAASISALSCITGDPASNESSTTHCFSEDRREKDGFICQCLYLASFGKNCEYQLPVGETLKETLDWQVHMRKENPQDVQVYGDVICYQMLECDSGVLCLDWREICDGIQHCLEGKDEENCDLLGDELDVIRTSIDV